MDNLQVERLEQHELIKNRIKQNINQVCANYISIAYDLKEISYKKLYIDAGYSGMGKYALSEFGISEDKCSWLIKVAEKFCLPGQAELMPEYKEFGISVLREMLPLSEEQLEEVDTSTTVAQIRDMKKAAKEELKEKDIEIQYGPINDTDKQVLNSIVDRITDKFISACEDDFLDDPEGTFESNQFKDWIKEELIDFDEIYIDNNAYYLMADEDVTLVNESNDTPICRISHGYIAQIINQKMNVIVKRHEEMLTKLNFIQDDKEQEEFATAQVINEEQESIPFHDTEELEEKIMDHIEKDIEYVTGEVVETIEPVQQLEVIEKVVSHQLAVEKESIESKEPAPIRDKCMYDDIVQCNIHNIKNIALSIDAACKGICCMSCNEHCGAECRESAYNRNNNTKTDIKEPEITINEDHYASITVCINSYEGNWEDCVWRIINRARKDYLDYDSNDIKYKYLKDLYKNLKELAELKKRQPNPAITVQQPVLPILKNNEQRGEFISGYTSWPIWIDQELTGERYYRYDLTNKVAMVVKVSRKHGWESYKETKDYTYGAEQYYLIGIKAEWSQSGNKAVGDSSRTFYECNTNKSTLIEYLKNFQKKE